MIAEQVEVSTPESIADLVGVPGYYLTDDDGYYLTDDDGNFLTDGPIRSAKCVAIIIKYSDPTETTIVQLSDPDSVVPPDILDGTNGFISIDFVCTDLSQMYLAAASAVDVDIIVQQDRI
ncbi:MAG: hypothetical protein GY845_25655 [Planctomycetes bacterium]|nr:hypothetical protein [Planctomycetota bacterium]